MKKITAILIGIVIILTGCNNVIDLNKEEEKIREVMNEAKEFGRKGDWENYMKYFDQTEKLQLINIEMGHWLKGWEEFSAYYNGIFSILKDVGNNSFEESKSEVLNVNISKNGNMAWANSESVWSFKFNPDKKTHIWSAIIFEKVNGEWKIVMSFSSGVKQIK